MNAERFAWPGVLAAALGSAVWVWWYTWHGAPSIPLADAWLWVEQVRLYPEGLATIFHRSTHALSHNEHVYALPTAIFHLTRELTDYSMRPYALTSAALLIALGALMFAVAYTAGTGRLGALLSFLAVVSLRHHESLLGGFQYGVVLSVVAATAALVVADRWRTAKGFAAAVALALVSAFSSAIGVLSLVLVVVVRFGEAASPRRLPVAIGVLLALVVAGIATIHAMDVQLDLYVERLARAFARQAFAAAIAGWVKVVGGGLIGGKAATIVGAVEIAWLSLCIVVDVRVRRRLCALPAIALLSLLSSFAVAWGRAPFDFDEPSSRWAIFAAPGTAAAVIWAFLHLRSALIGRLRTRLLIAVPIVWLAAANAADAARFSKSVEQSAFELRTYLAYFAAGDPLTDDMLRRFVPRYPERTREMIAFYNGLRPRAFREGGGVEIARELPASVVGQAVAASVETALELRGPGYVYHRMQCKFDAGCVVRVIVDVEAHGRATAGTIVRTRGGVERANTFVPVASDGTPHVQAVAVNAVSGESIDPYVFCYTADDRVRIRSFAVVISRDESASR